MEIPNFESRILAPGFENKKQGPGISSNNEDLQWPNSRNKRLGVVELVRFECGLRNSRIDRPYSG